MDLINQRQLVSCLQIGKPFYTEAEVLETLASLEVGLDEAWQIQRERNRYYLLRYLKQEKFQEIEALIIKTDGPKPLAELELVYLLNPFHVAGEKDQETLKKRRGTKVRLKIESLDPRADVLVLREIG